MLQPRSRPRFCLMLCEAHSLSLPLHPPSLFPSLFSLSLFFPSHQWWPPLVVCGFAPNAAKCASPVVTPPLTNGVFVSEIFAINLIISTTPRSMVHPVPSYSPTASDPYKQSPVLKMEYFSRPECRQLPYLQNPTMTGPPSSHVLGLSSWRSFIPWQHSLTTLSTNSSTSGVPHSSLTKTLHQSTTTATFMQQLTPLSWPCTLAVIHCPVQRPLPRKWTRARMDDNQVPGLVPKSSDSHPQHPR